MGEESSDYGTLGLTVGDREVAIHVPKDHAAVFLDALKTAAERDRLTAEVERLTRERDALRARVGQLEYLVCHCWIHSGYPDCGYREMERPLKALYCEVIQREDGPNYQAPVTDAPASWWECRDSAAEHAPKPADNFAACWSPPGWDERERED